MCRGAIAFDNRMIDAASLRMAETTVALAKAAGIDAWA
jgi:citrate lyase beta subunit